MIKLVTLNAFISGVESMLIDPIMSITVGSEKRVYGRSAKTTMDNRQTYVIVYAVVP